MNFHSHILYKADLSELQASIEAGCGGAWAVVSGLPVPGAPAEKETYGVPPEELFTIQTLCKATYSGFR